MTLYELFIKRLFDILFSFVGLVILIPVYVVVSVLIKMDGKGSVLFYQKRIGKNLKPFTLYKFRSMVTGSSTMGLSITIDDDLRITKIGSILRKTKIDEIPQLYNVLKGDMSLVGPRPEVSKYVEMFYNDYKHILKVRPGITDLASILYRDEASILGKFSDPEKEYVNKILPDKIFLAREYIKNMSFTVDLSIVIKTLLSLFKHIT
jgi:lipopolysaccharide/colanic/teichoic acid biosynthesis glycosyltransferase